jgi:hypothetical protein
MDFGFDRWDKNEDKKGRIVMESLRDNGTDRSEVYNI